jgi:dTDP-4-dehydrorhamnose reductase
VVVEAAARPQVRRVLITGAGGQLGTELVRRFETGGVEVVAADRSRFDLADPRAASLLITGDDGLDLVVNAGAWTAVDHCEADPDRAFLVNALACRWLADACRQTEAHLVQVSTDYVFDGTKTEPYHEWDEPNPTSVYGASKLAGEREVLAHLPGATVVRTSWVFGEHGHNMVKTVLSLRDRDELAFVDDQRGCPTSAADLADTIWTLSAQRIPGTFHVTNQGPTSWYGFVRDVLELAGEDPDKVRPIATADLDPPRPAPRPANSVLENRAMRLAGLPGLRHYREALEEVVGSLLA